MCRSAREVGARINLRLRAEERVVTKSVFLLGRLFPSLTGQGAASRPSRTGYFGSLASWVPGRSSPDWLCASCGPARADAALIPSPVSETRSHQFPANHLSTSPRPSRHCTIAVTHCVSNSKRQTNCPLSMVLLTMTPAMVHCLQMADVSRSAHVSLRTEGALQEVNEPSLKDPAVGKPISHGQVLDLWKSLNDDHQTRPSLEQLLRGSQVYSPPPPPKPEPVRAPPVTTNCTWF